MVLVEMCGRRRPFNYVEVRWECWVAVLIGDGTGTVLAFPAGRKYMKVHEST